MKSKVFQSTRNNSDNCSLLRSNIPVEHRDYSTKDREIVINGKRVPTIEDEPGAYGANN